MIKPGQIVWCKMQCKTLKGKIHKVDKPFYFSCSYEGFNDKLSMKEAYDKNIISKFGLKEDLIITKIEILDTCGFKIKTNQFTEVKASDEKRNKITGAYE